MDIPENITAKQMYDELIAEIAGKEKCYILLDEIQEIKGWEKAVNSLLEGTNADVYVTGSNSKLMSSEISTYLTGRYVLIPVFTLSFKEYLDFKDNSTLSRNELLEEYIRFGGFPIIAIGDYETQPAYQIVNGIYHTVVSRDIVKRHRINKQDLFDRVVKYVIENIGKTFSANSISNFLKNEHRKISVESIYNYLRWLEQAFIIYPCARYDLQGKSILKTQEKYYLADPGIRFARNAGTRMSYDPALENVLYVHLRSKGYEVSVGIIGKLECDFIVRKRERYAYVQVSMSVQDPNVEEREFRPFTKLADGYPKYLFTLDPLPLQRDGVRHLNLMEFLQNDGDIDFD